MPHKLPYVFIVNIQYIFTVFGEAEQELGRYHDMALSMAPHQFCLI